MLSMQTALRHSELAHKVLLVRPSNFSFNSETAKTNHFQNRNLVSEASEDLAVGEFEKLQSALESFGIQTVIFDSDAKANTPDAHFPNNWISTHSEGFLCLYPMETENRRRERRADIVDRLQSQFGSYEKLDFSDYEKSGRFLEGTGSLVLDQKTKWAYACLSSRTHPHLLELFSERLSYSVLSFHAVDLESRPIYHTNVMMSLGLATALICLDSIKNPSERFKLEKRMRASGREIISLRLDQLNEFCANMILLQSEQGQTAWFMSQRAFEALGSSQKRALEKDGELIAVAIPTIENLGGGSVRCMIAEIFPASQRSHRV